MSQNSYVFGDIFANAVVSNPKHYYKRKGKAVSFDAHGFSYLIVRLI